MKIEKIARIAEGQDGAIYGTELFRFDHTGACNVYKTEDLKRGDASELRPLATFRLDRSDVIAPHSNAVCFGREFYERDDEYPLLYSNVYNNYADSEDKRIGSCLVYRIQRAGDTFRSTLLQVIEIGFCENSELWKAYPDQHGDRPYGNFLVDADNDAYWAFVMRSEELGTRYFRFDLPAARDGETDPILHVKRVVLKEADVREYFDGAYCRYMQGATLNRGKIYSTEGFNNDPVNVPAIRVIDLAAREESYFDIRKLGFLEEPEFISFDRDTCLYSDVFGDVYTVAF